MLFCDKCVTPLEKESRFCPHCGYSPESPVPESIHLPVGSVLRDRYVIGMVLGAGSFGATYLGWDRRQGCRVAVKEYMPSEFATRSPGQTDVSVFKDEKKQKQFHDGHVKFMEEAEKLRKLPENEGIIAVYDSFNENKTGYLVMEYLQGETLAQRIMQGVFPAYEAINFIIPIANALRLAHSEGLIHGDICPENIFLTTDGRVKLIDFSAHRFATTSHSRSLSVVVKPGYSPEEQYRSRGDLGPYTDVYSLSAVLYRSITGTAPPDALERRASIERSRKDTIRRISATGLTKAQAAAIMNALNVMIEDRTPDMMTFAEELTSSSVKRKSTSIKKQILDLPAPVKALTLCGVVLVGITALLFALGVIRIGGSEQEIIPDGMNIVPSVIGMSEDEAADVLGTAGFQYIIGGTEYSTIIPKDFILLQNITAGTIAEANAMLSLTISGGPEMKEMPSVVGMDAEEAVAALEALGFAIKRDARPNNILEAGRVISASVNAGEMFPVGETVTLYVSRGHDGLWPSHMADVPNLVGKSLGELIEADDLEFRIEVIDRQYNQTIPEGSVISQSIAAGERVMSDEIIGIVVSLGRHVAKVPDVQYKTESEAKDALTAAGLNYAINYEESAMVSAGLVVSQSAAAGTSVDIGGTVTLVISTGKVIKIPNVTGEAEADARKKLSAEGLSVSVNYDTSSTVPKGRVIRQTPASGTELRVGESVTITVCSDKPPVTVPNVEGKDRNTARKELENKKFIVSINEVYSDSVRKDYVISQSLAGGSQQTEGSMVVLAVSLGVPPVEVPDFTPRGTSYTSQSNAESILRELGLNTSTTGEYHDSVPLGMIISQNPSAGNVLNKGSTVKLTVSLGIKTDYMPDLRGVSSSSAENTLRKMDLNLSIYVGEEYSTVKKGNVSSHSPSAGVLLRNRDSVTLFISLGPEPQPVPDVFNMTEQDAVSLIKSRGFKTSSTKAYDNYIEKGRVVSQSPAAGTRAEENTVVSIVVSNGPSTVNVPDVRNINEASAKSILQGEGFKVSAAYENSTVKAGDVISQLPSAGSSALWGSEVTITVSLGLADVKVPNVENSDKNSAISALENSGFTVRVVEQNAAAAAGTVILQDPPGNSSAAPGSEVTITVSLGPATVEVSNVVGFERNSAESTLRGAGFDVTVVEQTHDSVTAGTVISQDPPGNSSAAPGSEVTITVSLGPADPGSSDPDT